MVMLEDNSRVLGSSRGISREDHISDLNLVDRDTSLAHYRNLVAYDQLATLLDLGVTLESSAKQPNQA